MKRVFLIGFIALFLLGSVFAVYLLSNKHTTESTIHISGKVTDGENSNSDIVFQDSFTLGNIDVKNNPIVILDNITLDTEISKNVSFVFYPIITNLDLTCNNTNDVLITPYFITGKIVCVDFCQPGFTPLNAYRENSQVIENNSVLLIENIDLNKIQIKMSIKQNSCNQSVYLKTEIISL